MADPKKVANNILDFLIDPTKIPVQQRVYFRPEERLQNESYEGAKADACIAYKDQKHNSDFYPNRNRQQIPREAMIMDRKSLIASFDILSKNFKESDPIGTDLRTMALAVSKMSDEELAGRVDSNAPDFEGMSVEAAKTFPCPKCGTKVLEQTKYCVKCKAKVKPKSAAEEAPVKEEEPKEEPKEKKEDVVEASEVNDFWSKEATDLVAKALVTDVLGMEEEEEKEPEAKEPEEKEPEMKEEPKAEPKKEEEVESKKDPKADEKEGTDKSAGKIKGPGIPDGTGPMKDSPKCQMKKEEKEAAKVPEEKMPEEKEEKESTVVNTDILASITFGDIDAPMGEDLNMTNEEKTKLARLFN